MRLKSKIILLAVAPLIVATTIITYLGFQSARDLASQELAIYEFNLVDAKKQALKNHVNIAMSAIRPVLENTQLDDAQARFLVKEILAGLRYEDDGYFFAYEMSGLNLVHPTQPDFVGKNLWEFQDRTGNYLIQGLIRAAQAGGGFHRYIWEKPPLMKQEDKLGYVVAIDRWDWMMGTGLYLDDIYAELAQTKAIMNDNIQRSFLIVMVVVVLTVIVVILLGLAINLHEHKLADSRLKELAQRFMRLQVNERRGFSRELHDGINQLLVSCKFRIELAGSKLKRGYEKEVVYQELAKANEVMNQTISEIRQISHNLRPTLLDDLGLDTALSALVDQFMERTGIQVEYRFDVISTIPDEIEITLYRLTQESLTNIEKHASADNITLKVWQSYRHLVFKCADDGCGFSQKESVSSGIGLINMRERIELIGGDFSLESQRGKGTKIQAFLPLEQISG
ncbi:histidine kinase [Marinomonas sp. M1K-6]|uniref:Oxygen sensor histidine kinase NreB n=1 Tax=Marinomonas profundi TaxID=2726122 RepID=A0A847QW37_9GAMM|nr:cache domain-containing protein [Marinomonas profundi]NLQ17448.1 histidine kinase [Marinomonas profundi]UDV01971.1 cache domain-containing protein [Marinomonas profundi]